MLQSFAEFTSDLNFIEGLLMILLLLGGLLDIQNPPEAT